MSETAWQEQSLASNPHELGDKPARVKAMFASIAKRYDLNNRVHSFGLDQVWRRAAVRFAEVTAADDVIDVACGTGDLAEAFLAAGVRSVRGIDFTPEMLEVARMKAAHKRKPSAAQVEYTEGDATALQLPDACADVVSIAFGIRNVGNTPQALGEFHRILRPNGRIVILEFSQPSNPFIRAANRFYTHTIMPCTATILARDKSGAYRYLPRSVETYLDREALAQEVRTAGFSEVTQKTLTFGTCAITRAVKH
ncbi:MAG: bifunctional demethylmenaquinone methyltransferase/2-methoxy-6-polyprenyl-1,4-benzoquinol methylase UbiE [Phycisphaerales bacterium]|nr:bifunctional demethylmenaquinone methyltransferase/2-methoxy-6-polyprenyl-1,4-benzoquinol methylase UbiE [Phycisphaerales bacterium]